MERFELPHTKLRLQLIAHLSTPGRPIVDSRLHSGGAIQVKFPWRCFRAFKHNHSALQAFSCGSHVVFVSLTGLDVQFGRDFVQSMGVELEV